MNLIRLLPLLCLLAGCTAGPDVNETPLEASSDGRFPLASRLGQLELKASQTDSSAGDMDLPTLFKLVDESAQLKSAKARIAQEHGAIIQSGFAPDPVLGLEVEMMPFDNLGLDESKNKIKLSKRFETAGKAGARVSLSKARRNQAEAEYFQARSALRQQAAKAFYRAALIRRKSDAVDRMAAHQNGLLKLAEAMQASGRLSMLDLIKHETALDETLLLRQSLEAERHEALRKLEGQLGLAAGRIRDCSAQLDNWKPPKPEEAVKLIIRHNPDVIVSDRKRMASERDLALKQRGAYPDVRVGAAYIRATRPGVGRDDFLGAFVEVPLPLFNRNQGAIKSAEAALARAQFQLQAEAEKAVGLWFAAHESWRQKQANRELLSGKIIPRLKREVDLHRQRYEAGRATNNDVLKAAIKLEEMTLKAADIDLSLLALKTDLIYLVGAQQ